MKFSQAKLHLQIIRTTFATTLLASYLQSTDLVEYHRNLNFLNNPFLCCQFVAQINETGIAAG